MKVMEFEEIYRTYEILTAKLCEQGNDPLECAGVMMGQAMKMYKTALSPEEFEALLAVVVRTSIDDSGYEFTADTTNQTKH